MKSQNSSVKYLIKYFRWNFFQINHCLYLLIKLKPFLKGIFSFSRYQMFKLNYCKIFQVEISLNNPLFISFDKAETILERNLLIFQISMFKLNQCQRNQIFKKWGGKMLNLIVEASIPKEEARNFRCVLKSTVCIIFERGSSTGHPSAIQGCKKSLLAKILLVDPLQRSKNL